MKRLIFFLVVCYATLASEIFAESLRSLVPLERIEILEWELERLAPTAQHQAIEQFGVNCTKLVAVPRNPLIVERASETSVSTARADSGAAYNNPSQMDDQTKAKWDGYLQGLSPEPRNGYFFLRLQIAFHQSILVANHLRSLSAMISASYREFPELSGEERKKTVLEQLQTANAIPFSAMATGRILPTGMVKPPPGQRTEQGSTLQELENLLATPAFAKNRFRLLALYYLNAIGALEDPESPSPHASAFIPWVNSLKSLGSAGS